MYSDVSEQHVASIFRVEEYAKRLPYTFTLISWSVYYLTMNMEVTGSSETLVDFQ
jgi:hypothetical protein